MKFMHRIKLCHCYVQDLADFKCISHKHAHLFYLSDTILLLILAICFCLLVIFFSSIQKWIHTYNCICSDLTSRANI